MSPPSFLTLLDCVDPADGLVLGGVYCLVETVSGRLRVRAYHAPEVSLLLTHLADRFRPLSMDRAEAFCGCCSGTRDVPSFRFLADGTPIVLGTMRPCPGCDGSGVSVRAAKFRSVRDVIES